MPGKHRSPHNTATESTASGLRQPTPWRLQFYPLPVTLPTEAVFPSATRETTRWPVLGQTDTSDPRAAHQVPESSEGETSSVRGVSAECWQTPNDVIQKLFAWSAITPSPTLASDFCGLDGTRSGVAASASIPRRTRSGVIGKRYIRTPVALKIALAMAPMGGLAVISPNPLAPNGPVLEGRWRMAPSTSVSSPNAGIRYSLKSPGACS